MSHTNGVGTPAYIKGVPHPLPARERLLWEGAPSTRAVATHVFHWRLLAAYFTGMLLFWAVSTDKPFGSTEFISALVSLITLSTVVVVIALLLARLVASTSWYAITSHRLVLRLGMVFPMSINIPFTILESAAVGKFKDGSGQLLLSLSKGNRIAYIALWPHCSVFRFAQPQPVLRGLREPERIGALLAKAVADSAAADQHAHVQRGVAVGDGVAEDRGLRLPHPAGV